MSTVFLTVVSGTLIFVLGQIFLKLVLEPVAKLKQTISTVQFTLVKFAHIIHNSDFSDKEILDEVFLELRSLSGELYSNYGLVPYYQLTSKIFGLPSRCQLFNGAKNLIGLGNWMSIRNYDTKFGHIIKNSQEAYENLNIEVPEEDKINKGLIEQMIKIQNA